MTNVFEKILIVVACSRTFYWGIIGWKTYSKYNDDGKWTNIRRIYIIRISFHELITLRFLSILRPRHNFVHKRNGSLVGSCEEICESWSSWEIPYILFPAKHKLLKSTWQTFCLFKLHWNIRTCIEFLYIFMRGFPCV